MDHYDYKNLCDNCPVPQTTRDTVDCSTVCGAVRAGIDWQKQCEVLVKETNSYRTKLSQISNTITQRINHLKEFKGKALKESAEISQETLTDIDTRIDELCYMTQLLNLKQQK